MEPDNVPLKVKHPAGSYPCRWHLVDEETGAALHPQGELSLLPERSPSGSAYGKVPTKSGDHSWPQEFKFTSLAGELLNGAGVVLIDAWMHVISPPGFPGFSYAEGNANVGAALALVGPDAHMVQHRKIQSIRVQITGMDRILGLAPIVSRTIPNNPFSDPETTWKVVTRRDGGQEWENDELFLRVVHHSSATVFADYQFGIRFTPLIEIDIKVPIDAVVAFNDIVHSLVRVVSILTGESASITFLEMKPASSKEGEEMPYLQAFARPISQQPYQPEPGKTPTLERSLLRCADDDVSLLDLVSGWRKLLAEKNPLIYTYDPFALGADQHPRARFLLLVQALEGLSNRENRLADQQATYEGRKSRAVNACMNFLTGANRKFVKNKFPRSGVSLDDRLRDMFESLPADPVPHFDKLDIIKQVIGEIADVKTSVSAIRKIRNDLAHGSRSYNDYELLRLARLLQIVVRVHALRVLGVSDVVQARALNGLLPYVV
ncbi:HEPN domain-containing protein [Nocardia salmonicida]|uniref:HEPN domain-containing protein n=1 Tax=Nocardia salmonicida TaxID=53431 RepID=UPI0033FCF511